MQYAYHFLNLFAYKFLFETILYIPANFYSVHIFLLDNDILPVLNIQEYNSACFVQYTNVQSTGNSHDNYFSSQNIYMCITLWHFISGGSSLV